MRVIIALLGPVFENNTNSWAFLVQNCILLISSVSRKVQFQAIKLRRIRIGAKLDGLSRKLRARAPGWGLQLDRKRSSTLRVTRST